MHEKAIEKIYGQILASLKRCELVENWPQYDSFTAHVEALSKEVLKHKKEWITINDVYSIYYDLVYESILEKFNFAKDEKYSGLLCKFLGEDGIVLLAERLRDFYLSIPRNYSVYLPLPRISKNLDGAIKFIDGLELLAFDKAADVPGGYISGLSSFGNKFEINKVYLKKDVVGYCNNNLEGRTVKQALSSFKILIQQGLFRDAFQVIKGQPAGLGLLGGLTHYQIPKSNLVSVDETDEQPRVVTTELPIEFSKLLDSLDFRWENENPENFEKFSISVRGHLNRPALLIDSPAEEAIRVRSAIEWCFDSIVNENTTLSFLQVCIGLESLLGDAQSNGNLTETLADRCAYLVSNNIKGRNTIKEKFKELYSVRSKLVHGVTIALEHDQKWYKDWGKQTLEFAIVREIKNLELDN